MIGCARGRRQAVRCAAARRRLRSETGQYQSQLWLIPSSEPPSSQSRDCSLSNVLRIGCVVVLELGKSKSKQHCCASVGGRRGAETKLVTSNACSVVVLVDLTMSEI